LRVADRHQRQWRLFGRSWSASRTTTNDSATAGNVGEYVESVIVTGSSTALTTATAKTVTSISLTAGDWDVDTVVHFNPAGTTTITALIGGLSLTDEHPRPDGRKMGAKSHGLIHARHRSASDPRSALSF